MELLYKQYVASLWQSSQSLANLNLKNHRTSGLDAAIMELTGESFAS